jgi:hypothetical protein
MDYEGRAARAGHGVDEALEIGFRILIVDADAAFDSDGDAHALLHGGDAGGDQIRLGHEAGAEAALLHAIGRAADVEIDLVVAQRFADGRRLGELRRIGAAELQRQRFLFSAETQEACAIAMDHGIGRDHLRIEKRMARHEAVEVPAVPVRPIHHGGD